MASDTKTQMTGGAAEYIAALTNDRRRAEAERLDALFRRATGFKPMLWAGKMIGYGYYDYTYESGHSGRWFATGFAVPDRQITVYIMPGYTAFPDILQRLGKHRIGKACLYISRLDNVDESALEDLVRAGIADLQSRWPVTAT